MESFLYVSSIIYNKENKLDMLFIAFNSAMLEMQESRHFTGFHKFSKFEFHPLKQLVCVSAKYG